MPCFNSWSRKLAVLPLSLFLIGWLVYLVGFGWMWVTWTGGLYFYTEEDGYSIVDRKIYPFYVSLIFGLIVFLCGVLHAAVPQLPGVVGSVILALVSTVHFAATGEVAYESTLNITMTQYLNNIYETTSGMGNISFKNSSSSIPINPYHPNSAPNAVNTASVLMLIGSLVQVTSWMLVTICSAFYKYRLKKKSRTESFRGEDSLCPCDPKLLFSGPARKLSIPFIIISAIGWCILVSRLNFILFIPDSFLLLAPLLYIAALSHAGFTGALSTTIEVCICILSMIYVIFVGVTFNDYGNRVYDCLQLGLYDYEEDYRDFVKISGGIVSLIFWAGVPALWPFYRHRLPSICRKRKSYRETPTYDPDDDDDDDYPLIESV